MTEVEGFARTFEFLPVVPVQQNALFAQQINERRVIGFHLVFCKDINIQIGRAVSDVR